MRWFYFYLVFFFFFLFNSIWLFLFPPFVGWECLACLPKFSIFYITDKGGYCCTNNPHNCLLSIRSEVLYLNGEGIDLENKKHLRRSWVLEKISKGCVNHSQQYFVCYLSVLSLRNQLARIWGILSQVIIFLLHLISWVLCSSVFCIICGLIHPNLPFHSIM